MSKISFDGQKLTIEYNLFDLPTAQHKAGLAGLLVMLESLRIRKMEPLPDCEISQMTAKVSFNQQSLQTVMDDLFDAQWIEIKREKKLEGQKPKKIEEKEIEFKGKNSLFA